METVNIADFPFFTLIFAKYNFDVVEARQKNLHFYDAKTYSPTL